MLRLSLRLLPSVLSCAAVPLVLAAWTYVLTAIVVLPMTALDLPDFGSLPALQGKHFAIWAVIWVAVANALTGAPLAVYAGVWCKRRLDGAINHRA